MRFYPRNKIIDIVAVEFVVLIRQHKRGLADDLVRALGVVGDFSRPVLLIDWLLSMAVIGGLRMSVRVIGEAHPYAVVNCAGDVGTWVHTELDTRPTLAPTAANLTASPSTSWRTSPGEAPSARRTPSGLPASSRPARGRKRSPNTSTGSGRRCARTGSCRPTSRATPRRCSR